MKINKYILFAAAMLCMGGSVLTAAAQDVKLKVMEWNILSFERVDKSGERNGFPVADHVAQIQAIGADVVCFNEFETANGRMNSVDKLAECAKTLDMFTYVGVSYAKDGGYYGNGLMSRYPYINSATKILGRYNTEAPDIRSVCYIDIVVPTAGKSEGTVVRIVGTHTETFCDEYTKTMQAKEIIEFAIKPAIEQNIPVILMGDMNTYQNAPAIEEYEKIGTRLCNNEGTYYGTKLDYIISFPASKWSCTDYKVYRSDLNAILSDHYPIAGTAVLKN